MFYMNGNTCIHFSVWLHGSVKFIHTESIAVAHSSALLYDHPVLFITLVTTRVDVFVDIFKTLPPPAS